IPVALLFRWLASRWLDHADAIELAGRSSLFAYALGIIAYTVAIEFMTRRARKRYAETVELHLARTIELDRRGITALSKASQFKWQWTAVSRCTFERGLVLIWVGAHTAVPIPGRSFGSEAACAAALTFIRAQVAEASAAVPQPDT